MLIASTYLLWTVAALLSIAVVALARQLRALQRGMARLQSSRMPSGVPVGAKLPPIVGIDGNDRPMLIGTPQPGSNGVLLILMSGLDEPLRPLPGWARVIAANRRLDLVYVSSGPLERGLAEQFDGAIHARSQSAFEILDAADRPFAFLVGPDGVVAAKRAVGGREDLEALVASGRPPPFAERSHAIAVAAMRRASRGYAA